eukprot:2491632-Amphidinium_carterae.1
MAITIASIGSVVLGLGRDPAVTREFCAEAWRSYQRWADTANTAPVFVPCFGMRDPQHERALRQKAPMRAPWKGCWRLS